MALGDMLEIFYHHVMYPIRVIFQLLSTLGRFVVAPPPYSPFPQLPTYVERPLLQRVSTMHKLEKQNDTSEKFFGHFFLSRHTCKRLLSFLCVT